LQLRKAIRGHGEILYLLLKGDLGASTLFDPSVVLVELFDHLSYTIEIMTPQLAIRFLLLLGTE